MKRGKKLKFSRTGIEPVLKVIRNEEKSFASATYTSDKGVSSASEWNFTGRITSVI